MCFYNVEAQCLIPYMLLFSKPQLGAAPQRHHHGVIFTSTPTPSWTSTTLSFCKLLPAVRIFSLQRSCKPSVASFVTPPYTKKYIRGQDPVVLCACAFIMLYCWVASRRQSSWGVVVKAPPFALNDKDKSFFVKNGTVILFYISCILLK